ncbi:MAG TPA: outer membrane beta-barrel protein [Candidatus Acidoferrum sp.]|nr:outer membrane beta-barrel protein [Candidatus Acidoferrum sp.]
MRKLAYLVGLFVLGSLPSVAQETKTKDISLEYSYLRANPATSGFPNFDANGGSASLAFNPRNWFGVAGEFSAYHVGSIGAASVDTNLLTYMAGPQFYFRGYGRITPFVHQLFGAAHSTGTAFGIPGSRNSFAMAAGGGVDVPFKNHLSLRLGPVDYLLTEFPETTSAAGRKTQNNLRVSGGVRWRF